MKYTLRGAIIHQGSAESGHYYSLIKDEEKWYEFNDTEITSFDERQIPEVAFGGSMDRQHANRSAYILFYENKFFKESQELILTSQVSVEEVTEAKSILLGQENWELIQRIISGKPMYELCVNIQTINQNKIENFSFILTYFFLYLVRSNKYHLILPTGHYIINFMDSKFDASILLIKNLDNSSLITEFLLQCPSREIHQIILSIILSAVRVAIKNFNNLSFDSRMSVVKFSKRIFTQVSMSETFKSDNQALFEILNELTACKQINSFLRSIDFEIVFDVFINHKARFKVESIKDTESNLLSPLLLAEEEGEPGKILEGKTQEVSTSIYGDSISIEIACNFYLSFPRQAIQLDRLNQPMYWMNLVDRAQGNSVCAKLASSFCSYSKNYPEMPKLLMEVLKVTPANFKAVLHLMRAMLVNGNRDAVLFVSKIIESTFGSSTYMCYQYFDFTVYMLAEAYLFAPSVVSELNKTSNIFSRLKELNKSTGSLDTLYHQNVY